MEYRRLGKSGLQVSALSFGTWVTFGNQVNDGTAEACLKLAYEHGVNFFDNAEGYAAGQSEEVMGELLQKLDWRRDTYLVSSKVFFGGSLPNQSGLSRKHVTEACNAALRRLQVDYLDLYFCHRPDPNTPIEETVRAMNSLIEQGKVLYWGTSEWSAEEIQSAIDVANKHHLIGPTMEQPQYNLFHRDRVEKELVPIYESENGLGTTVWSPLASGLLTGKYNNGMPDDSRLAHESMTWLRDMFEADHEQWASKLEKVRRLGTIAEGLDTSLAKLSLAWCLLNPNVSTVILGASKVSQLKENLSALEVVPKLTPVVRSAIEEVLS